MNRKSILAALVLSAFAASASASDYRDSPVSVDTTGITPNFSAKIQKHASESLRSLSRYLATTRKHHNLVIEDVVKEPAEPGPVFGEKEYKRHAHEWKQAKN